MTLARRVAALEAALSPTQLVLRWLEEAHAHGSLDAYVRAILDDEPEDFPLNRLCREASGGARASAPGRARGQADLAVRGALRETVFRFELVMRINLLGHDLIERETLIDAALGGQLALVASAEPADRLADHQQRLSACRDLVNARLTELRAAHEARASAEARYLDGRAALFPDAIRAWAEQVGHTEGLVRLADRLAALAGVEPTAMRTAEAVSRRAAILLADLVEPAKVTALEKLGEGERAIRLATRWLRAKVVTTADIGTIPAPDDPTL